eukprot:357940-Chlamydomonas_euryale.AAC.1
MTITGLPRVSWHKPDGTNFHPMGLAWACHAVWCDLQHPWTVQALEFKAAGSRGVLLSCAQACSLVLFKKVEN